MLLSAAARGQIRPARAGRRPARRLRGRDGGRRRRQADCSTAGGSRRTAAGRAAPSSTTRRCRCSSPGGHRRWRPRWPGPCRSWAGTSAASTRRSRRPTRSRPRGASGRARRSGCTGTAASTGSPRAAAGGHAAGGPRAPGRSPPAPRPGPAARSMTPADRGLLDRLAHRVRDRGGGADRLAPDVADDLIGYGGAVLWEAPQRTFRIREAAHYLRQPAAPGRRPAAGASRPTSRPRWRPSTRPVAGTVRINMVYTPPERRRSGHAAAVTLMTSRAVLAGTVPGPARRRPAPRSC